MNFLFLAVMVGLAGVGNHSLNDQIISDRREMSSLFFKFFGLGRWARTTDLFVPNEAFYQTELYPDNLIMRLAFAR